MPRIPWWVLEALYADDNWAVAARAATGRHDSRPPAMRKSLGQTPSVALVPLRYKLVAFVPRLRVRLNRAYPHFLSIACQRNRTE